MAKDSLMKTDTQPWFSPFVFSISENDFKPEEKKDYVTVYFSSEILMREDKSLSSLLHQASAYSASRVSRKCSVHDFLEVPFPQSCSRVLAGGGRASKCLHATRLCLLALTQTVHKRTRDPRRHSCPLF